MLPLRGYFVRLEMLRIFGIDTTRLNKLIFALLCIQIGSKMFHICIECAEAICNHYCENNLAGLNFVDAVFLTLIKLWSFVMQAGFVPLILLVYRVVFKVGSSFKFFALWYSVWNRIQFSRRQLKSPQSSISCIKTSL